MHLKTMKVRICMHTKEKRNQDCHKDLEGLTHITLQNAMWRLVFIQATLISVCVCVCVYGMNTF